MSAGDFFTADSTSQNKRERTSVCFQSDKKSGCYDNLYLPLPYNGKEDRIAFSAYSVKLFLVFDEINFHHIKTI